MNRCYMSVVILSVWLLLIYVCTHWAHWSHLTFLFYSYKLLFAQGYVWVLRPDTILLSLSLFFLILLINSFFSIVCLLHVHRWWVGLGKVEVQTFVATFVWPYCVHAHMCFFFFPHWLLLNTLWFLRKTQNTTYDYRVRLSVQHFHQKRPWPRGFVIASCRKRNVTSWHQCQREWQKTLPLCCCLCRALSLWDWTQTIKLSRHPHGYYWTY